MLVVRTYVRRYVSRCRVWLGRWKCTKYTTCTSTLHMHAPMHGTKNRCHVNGKTKIVVTTDSDEVEEHGRAAWLIHYSLFGSRPCCQLAWSDLWQSTIKNLTVWKDCLHGKTNTSACGCGTANRTFSFAWAIGSTHVSKQTLIVGWLIVYN